DDTLVKVNGIRQSDVWYLLEDFQLALATLQTGLEHYLKAVMGDSGLESESSDEEEGEEGESKSERESESEAEDEPGAPGKPKGVSDGDWKVYRAVVLTKQEFDEKFRAMWS
ncbi:hypothetical protein FRC00_011381, partial [Tulasnella sp. 408]